MQILSINIFGQPPDKFYGNISLGVTKCKLKSYYLDKILFLAYMKVTPKFLESSTIPQIFNISYSVEVMKPELRALRSGSVKGNLQFQQIPMQMRRQGRGSGELIKKGREEIEIGIRVGSIIPVIKNGNNIKRIVDGRIGGLPRTWRQRQKDPLNR